MALFWTVLRAFDVASLRVVVFSILAGSADVTVYGLVQPLGADPYAWDSHGVSGVFSMMANPNFLAGYLAVTLPLTLWAAVSTSVPAGWRVAAGAVAGGAATVMWATESFQGPVAAVAGALVLVVAWTVERWSGLGAGGRRLAAGGALVALGATAAAALVAAPGVVRQIDQGLVERRMIWRGAASIFAGDPVLGTGLDTFGLHFLAHRPAEHAVAYGSTNPEQAHSVPLGMFTDGGALLGLAYLAFVGYVGWVLVRGLGRLRGEQRLLLAGCGGAWVVYQVQSLVSLNVPPLAVLHWVLAGAIIVVAGRPQQREFAVPGLNRAPPRRGRRGRPASAQWTRVAVTAGAAAAIWPVTLAVRADVAAGSGTALAQQGAVADALAELEHAVDLAPYRSNYWLYLTAVREASGDTSGARESAVRAAELDFGSARQALLVAQLTEKVGDVEEAREWYAEALRRDAHNPDSCRERRRSRGFVEAFGERTERQTSGGLIVIQGP